MLKQEEKKYTWALKLFISLDFISVLFKLLHWPFYDVLAFLSPIVLVVFYPLRYRAKTDKKLLDHVKMAWVLVHCISILASLQNVFAMILIETLLFFFWFVHEGFFYFDFHLAFWKEKERDTSLLDVEELETPQKKSVYIIDYLFIASVILYIGGFLFKIMHWPFALETLISSSFLFVILIWFKKF